MHLVFESTKGFSEFTLPFRSWSSYVSAITIMLNPVYVPSWVGLTIVLVVLLPSRNIATLQENHSRCKRNDSISIGGRPVELCGCPGGSDWDVMLCFRAWLNNTLLMALSPQTFLLGLLCCYSNDRHCWKLHAAGGLLGILATLHLLAQRMHG